MKQTLLLFVLFNCLGGYTYSQERIELDYIVDYIMPDEQKGIIDTIKIGYDREGKYIWTNYEGLTRDLSSSLFKGNSSFKNSKSDLIYNAENNFIYFAYEDKNIGNVFFLKAALPSFFPIPQENTQMQKVNLISEKTGEKISILEQDLPQYEIYPSNNTSKKIYAVFDKNMPLDNNKLLSTFLETILGSMGMVIANNTNLPNGLLLEVIDNGGTLLRAVRVSNVTKKITLNFSISTTE